VVEPNPAPRPKTKPAAERERRAGEPSAEVLGTICEQMGSRSLRRFATAHLRDRAWLRRAGPDALRLRAPDPAALVLRAVGRCYISAESENAEAACVLFLELYVRAGCPRGRRPEAEAELRAEARVAALSWRSRIVRDKGRVADASARDGRSLMAAFGVPPELPLQELYDLLLAGGCLACADVLKFSQLFPEKLCGEGTCHCALFIQSGLCFAFFFDSGGAGHGNLSLYERLCYRSACCPIHGCPVRVDVGLWI
jgi:hypothetical protein